MTELALILGIQVAALAYAWFVGRPLFASRGLPNRLTRLGDALERAAALLANGQTRSLLLMTLVLAIALSALHFVSPADPELHRPAAAATAVLGLLFGAGGAWFSTRSALKLGLRSGVWMPAAAARGLDPALSSTMRAGAAGGLTLEATSALGLAFTFGAVFALLGGTTLEAQPAYRLALTITRALASYPLGAALVALVYQRSGTTFQAAAELGGGATSEAKFGLSRDDPRSPTLVGELTGEHVGEAATRTALLSTAASTSNLALLALGLCAASLDPVPRTALVLLPFLVRAFFLLATGFGAAVVRTEEMTSPSAGIFRGYCCTLVVGLTGLFGACVWLARPELWAFAGAGVLGASIGLGTGVFAWSRLARGSVTQQETSDVLRSGGGSAALLGLGGGMRSTWLPFVTLGLGSALCWKLGVSTDLPAGGLWALLVGWSALLGTTPFAFAANVVGSAARGARGVSALSRLDPEALRRATRLEETQLATSPARSQLVVAGSGSALLAALAVPALARGKLGMDVGLLDPAVMWSGALAMVLVLSYAGVCSQVAVRTGRSVALEVDRQLRRFPRVGGASQLPLDFSPSYRACVDLASRGSLTQLVSHIALPLAAPACLALFLYAWYHGAETSRSAEGLMSFVLLASLMGFASLALDYARATLCAARRATRSANASDLIFNPNADGLGEVLGYSAAPAAQALTASAAAIALALAPFLK